MYKAYIVFAWAVAYQKIGVDNLRSVVAVPGGEDCAPSVNSSMGLLEDTKLQLINLETTSLTFPKMYLFCASYFLINAIRQVSSPGCLLLLSVFRLHFQPIRYCLRPCRILARSSQIIPYFSESLAATFV